MNKFQLLYKLAEDLENSGYKARIILQEPKPNPLVEVSKDGKRIYVVICEAGTKPAKYKNIVFCGISPLIQNNINVEQTYVVIIDFQPVKPKYILAKLDDTNYRRNKINYFIFHFKRPEYGEFFNTEDLTELTNEIQRVLSNK